MQLVSHPRSVPFGLGAPVHVGKFVVQADQMLGFVTDPERLLCADQRWRPAVAPRRGVPPELLTQLAVAECRKRAGEVGLEMEVRQLLGVKLHEQVLPGVPVAVDCHVHARAVENASGRAVQVISAELQLRRLDGQLVCSFHLSIALSAMQSVAPVVLPTTATPVDHASSCNHADYLRVA